MSKKIDISSPLLNVRQAAAFLSVSVGTIRRWAKHDQVKGIKVGIRGDWRFTKEALSHMTITNLGK